jgi:2-polyprenyl-3-methyl-5-hydroxy-6-metoxy-1,4-benzoquinol methylase
MEALATLIFMSQKKYIHRKNDAAKTRVIRGARPPSSDPHLELRDRLQYTSGIMTQDVEHCVTDKEYATYFSELNNLRHCVIQDIPFRHGMHILDLAAGHGFFTKEIARKDGGEHG